MQICNYITASRAERARIAHGGKPATDNLVRFTKDFDHDPGVGPPPAASAPRGGPAKAAAGG